MTRKNLVQFWVRGDKEYRKYVTDKAEALGYKTSEFVRRAIDLTIESNGHIFFTAGDDFKRQQTTNDPE